MPMGDPLEDLFRQRLENHEEAPPFGAWHRIQEDIKPAAKPKRVVGWWLASLLLLSVATAVLLLRIMPAGIENQAATAEIPSETSARQPIADAKITEAQSASAEKPHANGTGTSSGTANPQNPVAGTGNELADATVAGTKNAPATDQNTSPASEKVFAKSKNRSKVSTVATITSASGRKSSTRKRSGKNTLAGGATGLAVLTTDGNPAAASNLPESGELAVSKPVTGKNEAATTEKTSGPGQIPGNDLPVIAGTATTTPDKTENGAAANPENPNTAQAGTSESTLAESISAAIDSIEVAVAQADSLTEAALAPDTENVSPVLSKNRLGFYAGSQVSFRKFTPNSNDDVFIDNQSLNKKSYAERINAEAGVMYQRRITSRLAIEGAIGMAYSSEKLAYRTTETEPATITSTFTATGLSLQQTRVYKNHRTESTVLYTRLRAGMAFTALRGSFADVAISGGGLLNSLAWHKTKSTINNETVETSVKPSRLQTGLYGGIRFSHQLSRKLDIALEPGFTYYFNSGAAQDRPYKVQTHTYNLNLLFFFR